MGLENSKGKSGQHCIKNHAVIGHLSVIDILTCYRSKHKCLKMLVSTNATQYLSTNINAWLLYNT